MTIRRQHASTTRNRCFREKLLEHVFVSELLQEAWLNRHQTVEVLRSEVDASALKTDESRDCNPVYLQTAS